MLSTMYRQIARIFSWAALVVVAVDAFEPSRVGMALLFAACVCYEQYLNDEENHNRNRH